MDRRRGGVKFSLSAAERDTNTTKDHGCAAERDINTTGGVEEMIAVEMWEASSKERAVKTWRRSIRKDLKEVGVSENADSVTQMHSRRPTERQNRLTTIDTTNPLDLPTEKNTRDTRHKAVVYDADTSGVKVGWLPFCEGVPAITYPLFTRGRHPRWNAG